jgi:hypothetical protein
MLSIGRQASRIAGDYIDGREIADQRHGDTAGAGEAGKLDIERIPVGNPEDAAPFPGMGRHHWAGFIAG